jgi:hypothetical protein
VPDAVHRLERHAGGQGAISDDRDDVVVVAFDVARDGHSLGGGNRGPGVSGAELIVLGLVPGEEARDPAELAERVETSAPAGEHLVDVRLMTGVPDELVVWGIEDAMQRHRELDRAEAG